GPGYVGHELMTPEIGDCYALPAENEGRVQVRNPGGIELLSNVCRHRQAIMLNGRGHADNIVCPLHRWTYDLSGNLLGAPHFERQPCVALGSTPLQNWRGDRKSTRLNSSHVKISYAVFCLKKKKQKTRQ